MAGGYVMERDVEVPMRDGTILRADVYRPLGDGPFPALLQRTPYDKSSPIDLAGGPDERRATAAGYVDGAPGLARPISLRRRRSCRSSTRRTTATTRVEWVAAQAWCDGNVGMFGASYVGYTQWTAASRRPPHLRAIAPVVATSDLHDFWIYEGGAPSLWFNMSWVIAALGPDITMNAPSPATRERLARLITAIDQLGDHLPGDPGRHRCQHSWTPAGDDLYRTWVDHPERDAYWTRALAA